MRSTPIGIAMLNDERPHVWQKNNPQNTAVVTAWAEKLRSRLINRDGTAPEIVVGSEIITGVRSAQKVGEEMSRAHVKQIVMLYNVWNFPFLVWPFLNTLGPAVPILSLSNNNGQYPGNVGLLATDGALRQAGLGVQREQVLELGLGPLPVVQGEVDDTPVHSDPGELLFGRGRMRAGFVEHAQRFIEAELVVGLEGFGQVRVLSPRVGGRRHPSRQQSKPDRSSND